MLKWVVVWVLFLGNTMVWAGPDLTLKADFSVLEENEYYRFETFTVHSLHQDPNYRVYVAIPKVKPPIDGFPIIYALDGNALLEQLKPSRMQWLSQKKNPPVIVLLGYESDLRLELQARAFDYTVARFSAKKNTPKDSKNRKIGGARLFLTVLEKQIKPKVNKFVKINQHNQTLWGHSYGGVFALYTLLSHADYFQHYIAADPALYLETETLKQEVNRFLRDHNQMAPTTLWILKSGVKAGKAAVHHALVDSQKINTDFINRLDQISCLNIRYEYYADDTHGSLFAKSFQAVLSY